MHRGRLFPQITQRWASPDWSPRHWAPAELVLWFNGVYDLVSFNNEVFECPLVDVNFSVGIITWAAAATVRHGLTMRVLFWQDTCHRPSDRTLNCQVLANLSMLGGHLHTPGDSGFFGYDAAPIGGDFDFDVTVAAPLWQPGMRLRMMGKPYY